MELFGVGPLELLLILMIALIVLGPRDMIKTGRSMGRFLRKTILSPTWVKMQQEIRNLPYQMMREAGLEEEDLRIKADLEKAYRWNPANNRTPLAGRSNQPHDTSSDQVGELDQSVPSEWLGFPNHRISSFPENLSSHEPQPLDAWTSPPSTASTDPEPTPDKETD